MWKIMKVEQEVHIDRIQSKKKDKSYKCIKMEWTMLKLVSCCWYLKKILLDGARREFSGNKEQEEKLEISRWSKI